MRFPPVTNWIPQETDLETLRSVCRRFIGECSRNNPCEGAREAGLDRGNVTAGGLSCSLGKLWSWDGLSELA